MDIKCYLAMTAAEFAGTETRPQHAAWMACHFSSAGEGLSNLPRALPPDSIVLVDDSLPPNGHDPERIARQLTELTRLQPVIGIILDLQRKDLEENAQLAKVLTEQPPCPICVSSLYAQELNCPVFLPPPPLHASLETHITPWKGREIWLEVALETEQITVTEDGSAVTVLPFAPLADTSFEDPALCCRYTIRVEEDHAVFTLTRNIGMLKKLLEKAEKLGIRQAVGLYQQLGQSKFL